MLSDNCFTYMYIFVCASKVNTYAATDKGSCTYRHKILLNTASWMPIPFL